VSVVQVAFGCAAFLCNMHVYPHSGLAGSKISMRRLEGGISYDGLGMFITVDAAASDVLSTSDRPCGDLAGCDELGPDRGPPLLAWQ
jgi:hypothetical protein